MADEFGDIVAAMKKDFLADCQEKLNRLDEILAHLDAGSGDRPALLFDLKRLIHSIKGNAGSFGFSSITHIAHSLEDFLTVAGEGDLPPTQLIGRYLSIIAEIVDGGSEIGEEETAQLIADLSARTQISGGDGAKTVLIHIPDKVWRKIMTGEMTRQGFRVSCVETEIEAIDRGVILKPTILVTSMQLSRMTGLELAAVFAAIKATGKTSILILVSQDTAELEMAEHPDNAVFLRKAPDYQKGLSAWIAALGS